MSIRAAELSGCGGELAPLLLENIRDYAVFALDPDGRVLSWSAPAERLLGYREQEAIGQPADRFYTAEDIAGGVPARELQQALAAGRVEEERWYLRKDGSRFWSGGVTTALVGADGRLRGFAKLMRDRTAERQAGQARDEALAYARSIVETVREPLVVLDGQLRVLSANRAFYRSFGVAPPDTEGRLLYELGDGQWNIPRLRTLLEEILPQRSSFDEFEVEHDFPGVGRKAMLLNARRLRQADAERILLAFEDVTERRRAEAERQALETRFTSLVKNIRDHSVFTLDTEGRVTSWNVAAEQILGYSEDEVLGRPFEFIFTPEDRRAGLPEAELRLAREQGRAEDERWHLRKGDERFWALGIVSALHDAGGRLVGFSKILRDMTAWKQAQQALRDSETRHRALFEAVDEGVCLFERLPLRPDGLRDYRYVAMNPAMQAMFGIPDLSGQSIRDNFPDEVEDWYDDYDRVLETGRPLRFERESVPQGKVLEMYVARVGDDSGAMLLAVMQDITARRRAEEALAESEARYRALVQASSEAVYRMNADWTEMRQLVGRDFIADTAMPSRTWLEHYIEPADRPRVLAAIGEAIRNKAPFELEHPVRRADGSLGWTFSRAVPMVDRAGEIVEWIGMASDITERKCASEAKYRTLFESIDEGFCIVEMIFDAQGRPVDYRYLEVNPAFARQTGIDDAVGRTMREIAPTHEAHWFESYGRVATTGEASRFRNRAAALHRWYDVYAWRQGDARQRQVAILFNDVTDRVQAEASLRGLNESLEARVQERTRQVRGLAGRLTLTELEERRRISQILHDDLQQLLYGIEMKLRQVESDLPPTDAAPLRADLRDALAWIAEAITATRRLTVDLSPPILQKEGLADALEWLRRQMSELHGLEVTLEAAHGFYMPDHDLRVLLFQVVRELLFNVAKHSGTKRATVRLEETDGQLVIHVIDGGAGFDVEEVAGREGGSGGFGLFSVRERLGLIGGRLIVRSQPGEGTHIEIHAPPARERRPDSDGAGA
ncbi:PAS domain-containing sensor histidine kinase [Piscinibacter defluvii]|uniref:PAS domain-containing sensor histidine kinase n=1 Tax=Piscinibacter defluvii TaxID=1796922 RepID=UPI000FDD867B|nr:PAS domain S-box protein [Piscinibacter defluvii]